MSEPSMSSPYQAVVGVRNPSYYLAYFRRAEQRGYPPISWNWPVFFLGLFWFIYRKQYLWALVVFLFPSLSVLGAGLVEGFIPGMGQPTLLTLVFGFQLLYLPMNANGIYYRWAKREVERARAELPGQADTQLERLASVGGCNHNLPMVVFGLFTLLTILLSVSQAP